MECSAKYDTAVSPLAFAFNDIHLIEYDTSQKALKVYSVFLLPGKVLKVFPNFKRLGRESNAVSWAKCCVSFTDCRLGRPWMK